MVVNPSLDSSLRPKSMMRLKRLWLATCSAFPQDWFELYKYGSRGQDWTDATVSFSYQQFNHYHHQEKIVERWKGRVNTLPIIKYEHGTIGGRLKSIWLSQKPDTCEDVSQMSFSLQAIEESWQLSLDLNIEEIIYPVCFCAWLCVVLFCGIVSGVLQSCLG